MAILFGFLSNEFSEEKRFSRLARALKWPGALEHSFHFHGLHGGIMLNQYIPGDVSDYLYIDRKEQILAMVSGYLCNRNELLPLVNDVPQEISFARLVVELFRKEGKDFVKKLNGDFTIVIYRPKEVTLLLYRDQVGIRSMACSASNGSFWFCSDGIVLSKVTGEGNPIDRHYLLRFLDDADTVNLNLLPDSKVKKLMPGCYLEVKSFAEPVTVRYWFPEKIKENKRLDLSTAKNDLKKLVKAAVAERCDSNFMAGAHLSGGLDSGIVAALVRQNYIGQPSFKGFSWSPPYDEIEEVKDDERKLVEETARACNIEPVWLGYGKEDMVAFYNDWKLPGKSLHETKLRDKVHQEGINLLFSGWGGDEFISLNNRGLYSDLFFRMKWGLLFGKESLYRPLKALNMIFKQVVLPAAGINLLPVITKPGYLKTQKRLQIRQSRLYRWKSRRGVHLALLNFGHLAERAEQWFLDGYPEGIEYRYPLLDKRLIEYMMIIPSSILFKKGYARLMLREISDGLLPPSVAWSKSKNNPALFENIKRICLAYYREALKELPGMKKNKDFGFIRFNVLEKDIANLPETGESGEISQHVVFVLMLRHLHTFTSEYYRPLD